MPRHKKVPRLAEQTPEQYQAQVGLTARVLEFFTVEPNRLKAYGINDLVKHEDFKGYTEEYLRDLVHSMRKVGLIARFPHLRTRAARYYTTQLGRTMLESLREK